MTGRKLERDHAAAAIGKHVGLLRGYGSQQSVNVIGENLDDVLRVERALELAAREAARVIRHNGVIGGKLAGDVPKRRGVSRAALAS